MGGLKLCAAGALSNRAEAGAGSVPRLLWAQVFGAETFSMAEWQISQAEQAAEW